MRFQVKNLICLLPMYAICISAQGAPTTSPEQSIERAFEVGNFELGLRLAEAAVRQTPRNVKLWAFEGIALSHLGHPSRALEAYNHALEISPDYLPALEGAAELQYNLATERAVPLLNRILKIHPADPTAHAMMGVLAYKRHDCRSAVSHFRASKELISSQAAALAEYGSCLVDLELPEDAIPVFQQLLALEPADTHARYNLAVVEFNAHQAKSALSTLEPLLDATPSDPDALELAASAYEESGDTPNAVRLLRQAIALNPKNPKYYVDVATISFNHQSFQVGVDMINAGLTENPEAAVLYVARGILYVQLGRYGQGEADFETANRLDPRQTSGAVAQGLAQIEQSNLDRARSTVELELKSHPRDPFLHFLKAQILFQKSGQPQSKEFQDAIGAASLAVEIEPDLVLARDLLASLYLKSGQLEQSIAQSRRALKENPSDQEALYHLIQALRQSGKDKGELPGLVKRLAAARQESRNAEALGNKYKLYEPPAESSPSLAK